MRLSRSDFICLSALAIVGVALLWFGARFHDVEATGTAESDRFVEKAQTIRDGELPEDPYRPLLYPLLSAAAGELLDDTFAGARLVSQLSALALLLVTGLLGRRCFGTGAGILACGLLLGNVFFIEHAVVAATDMLFAALLGWTLFALTSYTTSPRPRRVVLLAALFTLASFTRYAALGLLPCLLVGVWVAPGGLLRGTGRVLLFLAATLVFLIPHFMLTDRVFDSPFHHENIQNLLTKIYEKTAENSSSGGMDLSDVADSPRPFLASAWHLARGFVAFDFGFLAANKSDLLGPVFTGLLFLGLFTSAMACDRRLGLLMVAFVGYLGLVFCSKLSMPRTLMPVLPLAYLFIAHFLTSVRWPGSERNPTHKTAHSEAGVMKQIVRERFVSAVLIALILALQLGALIRPLRDFVDRHPHAEIDAARWLQREYGSEICVAGTYAHIGRHTSFDYHPLRPRSQQETPKQYVRRVDATCQLHGAEYLLVGRVSLRSQDTPWSEAKQAALVAVHRTTDAVVYRRTPVLP